MEDFPVDSPNPFKEQFCGSDLVLIIKGKKLHTHRVILSLYCSYFRVLLESKDFTEADAEEIELKGDDFVKISYDAMVTFLRCLYPVTSVANIRDDAMLEAMFSMSEYFQCQHVRAKCEAYLQQKADLLETWVPCGRNWRNDSTKISGRSVCLYLWLCEKYGIRKWVKTFLDISCRKELSDIQRNWHFKSLCTEMQRDVHLRRVQLLEQKLDDQLNVLTRDIFSRPEIRDGKCDKCGDTQKQKCVVCRDCRDEFIHGFKSHF